jgi:hypothetical protein
VKPTIARNPTPAFVEAIGAPFERYGGSPRRS